jgi:hypothetical protein
MEGGDWTVGKVVGISVDIVGNKDGGTEGVVKGSIVELLEGMEAGVLERIKEGKKVGSVSWVDGGKEFELELLGCGVDVETNDGFPDISGDTESVGKEEGVLDVG